MASRTKNASKNIFWGILNKITVLLLPFITRTVMIYTLGSEYLGLNGLFTSVFNVLSLAELGVGSAMVYAMYKPLANKEDDIVCALLNLYKKMYRCIGCILLVIGFILMPNINMFISGDSPASINIYLVYIIYFVNTIGSYFLFAYQASILNASQRNDISSKVNMITSLIKNCSQIVVLLLLKNYYIYAIFLPMTTFAANIIVAILARKMYPQYICKGKVSPALTKEIKSKIMALFAVKITSVIYNSVDSIVISTYLGLIVLAKYNNYYYIMSAIVGVVTVIYSSIISSVGNSIVLESKEKNYADYMNLSFINAWIVGFCTASLYCLYQPFMKLWVGEEYMFGNGIVICFCMYFYIHQLKSVQSAYKDAAGLWKEDMWRSYAANIFNLVVNIILVQKIGVYGVLISTILALLVVTYPWQTWMIHKKLFNCSMLPYIKRLLLYTVITVIACVVSSSICDAIPGESLLAFGLKVITCGIVPNVIFFAFTFRIKEFSSFKLLINKMVRRS